MISSATITKQTIKKATKQKIKAKIITIYKD